MSSRILLNTSTPRIGSMLSEFCSELLVLLQKGRRIKAILDSCQYGDPADWAHVALELGLTGQTAADDAQAVSTIFSTAMAAIDVAEVAELARLDQG